MTYVFAPLTSRRLGRSLGLIVEGLGAHRNEILKYVEELDGEGLLEKRRVDGRLYFSAAAPAR